MKKLTLWFVTMLTVLATVGCLVACGGVAGTYKFYSLKVEQAGIGIELKVGEKYLGVLTLSEDIMVFELGSDGSVSLKQDSGTGETTQTGTWKVNPDDSSKIDITIGGITETASCSGGTLIINNSALGGTVTLKK